LAGSPERREVLHCLLHLESFARYLRRRRAWVHAELRREP